MLDTDLSIKLYQSIAAARTDRPMTMWYPSSICACPRAMYLKRLGKPVVNKPSAAKLLRWQAGSHLEAAIRPYIHTLFPGTTSNDKFKSEKWDMSGESDNLTIVDATLREVKSVDDWAFLERKEDGKTITTLKEAILDKNGLPVLNPQGKKTYRPKLEPYIHHRMQNYCYVLILAEKGIVIKKITIIYVSLKGRLVAYTEEVDPKYLEAVKRRLTLLNEAWSKQEMPECECVVRSPLGHLEPNTKSPLWGPVLQWCDYRNDEKGVCCE